MCSERREDEASGRFASHGRLEGIDLRRVECELEGEARDAICKACVRAGRTTVCAERRRLREMGSRRRAVEDDERVEVDKARRQGFSASVVRLWCWLREESVRKGVD